MYGYLFRRLLGTIPVMLVVAIFIFLMLRLTPSDPAAIIAGDNATTEQVARSAASSASTGRWWSSSSSGPARC